MKTQPTQERRARERSPEEARVTMVIQTILANPPGALELLRRELREGGDPASVTAMLDLAANTVRARGLQLSGSVGWIREQLGRSGYRV
jgi:hypothetical protein